MGKPSEKKLTKTPSRQSVQIEKQEDDMPKTSKKYKNKMKKRNLKMRKSIAKLFDELRNSSCSSSNNTTVIELDKYDCDKKRKREENDEDINSKRARNENPVLFNYDGSDYIVNVSSTFTPQKEDYIDFSTPINNKKSRKNLQDLIASNFSGNQSNIKEIDLTDDIDSSPVIDLTKDPLNKNMNQNSIIDLDNTDSPDCTVVPSNASLSMSGDSDVTILQGPTKKRNKSKKEIRTIFNKITKLGVAEKTRLLQNMVNLMNEYDLGGNLNLNSEGGKNSSPAESLENSYIREVILGQGESRTSIGSNIYNPQSDPKNKTGPRAIIIDGSNVAMEHLKNGTFSVEGLKICIDYFLRKGHTCVKAFVPRFRDKFGKSSNPNLLRYLERRQFVVFTPSREVEGQYITSYDDRFIVQCAVAFDGIVVSGDNYRDLLRENPRWRFTIKNRLLPFTWVNDMIMFPRDPLGRNGPTLEQFLNHPPPSTVTKMNSNLFR